METAWLPQPELGDTIRACLDRRGMIQADLVREIIKIDRTRTFGSVQNTLVNLTGGKHTRSSKILAIIERALNTSLRSGAPKRKRIAVDPAPKRIAATNFRPVNSFARDAELSQALKAAAAANHGGWLSMPAYQREAIEMILHKLAIILSGDNARAGNWNDVADQAHMVANILQEAS
jgi:hypothetical protein